MLKQAYYSWLDSWDEQRARSGEVNKISSKFVVDTDRAFIGGGPSITDFCEHAERATGDPEFFVEPSGSVSDFMRVEDGIEFTSGLLSGVVANDLANAKITEGGSLGRALVVFHHWNATKRQSKLAKFLAKRGVTVVEMSMPYHFERSRPESDYADYMLSANLGRTLHSVRQAVIDGRKLIRWLKSEGYGEVSVMGMSLGSWVAGLIAAHDANVSKASLFLTGGSLAEMVWTGRATRAIRESFHTEISLEELERAWSPLNLQNYAAEFARPGLNLQVVLAQRDTVVLPSISEQFLDRLDAAAVDYDLRRINCGHYSLALPPHILIAGSKLYSLIR